jgi:hypothetical protein
MSYLNQGLNLQDLSLSTMGGLPDIDLMENHLTSCILEAKNIAVPNVVPYRYKLKLTEEINDLIRFRNQCRRHWGQNKNRELKKFVNKLTKDIRLRVFALRGRNWSGLRKSSRGNQTKLPLKSGKSVYVTNLEKSNLIANAFSNVYQSHDFNVSNTENEKVKTSIDIIRNSVIKLTPNVLVSPTEVRNKIRSLRLTKAPGPDQINNRLLKKLPRKAIVHLTHIMNACFKYSYFPTAWKQGNCKAW